MTTTEHPIKRRRRFRYPPGTTPEQVAKALLRPTKPPERYNIKTATSKT